MSTEDNKKQGLTYVAATVDLFNINKHLDGLSRFIKACNTPMTISIQGSWGSGKTSIMKMVEHEIEKDVIPVFFNTWQFSQFELGNSLAFSMIKVFLNKLQDKHHLHLHISPKVQMNLYLWAVQIVDNEKRRSESCNYFQLVISTISR